MGIESIWMPHPFGQDKLSSFRQKTLSQIMNYMFTEWMNEWTIKLMNKQEQGLEERRPCKHAPHGPTLYQMDYRMKEDKMLKC